MLQVHPAARSWLRGRAPFASGHRGFLLCPQNWPTGTAFQKDRLGVKNSQASSDSKGWERKEIYQARRCAKLCEPRVVISGLGIRKQDAQWGDDLGLRALSSQAIVRLWTLLCLDAWDLAVPLIPAASCWGRAASDWEARKPPSTLYPKPARPRGSLASY